MHAVSWKAKDEKVLQLRQERTLSDLNLRLKTEGEAQWYCDEGRLW